MSKKIQKLPPTFKKSLPKKSLTLRAFLGGAILGSLVMLVLLTVKMGYPACTARFRLEAARNFCASLAERTVATRCEGFDPRSFDKCAEMLYPQVEQACKDLVGMSALEAQTASCK